MENCVANTVMKEIFPWCQFAVVSLTLDASRATLTTFVLSQTVPSIPSRLCLGRVQGQASIVVRSSAERVEPTQHGRTASRDRSICSTEVNDPGDAVTRRRYLLKAKATTPTRPSLAQKVGSSRAPVTTTTRPRSRATRPTRRSSMQLLNSNEDASQNPPWLRSRRAIDLTVHNRASTKTGTTSQRARKTMKRAKRQRNLVLPT